MTDEQADGCSKSKRIEIATGFVGGRPSGATLPDINLRECGEDYICRRFESGFRKRSSSVVEPCIFSKFVAKLFLTNQPNAGGQDCPPSLRKLCGECRWNYIADNDQVAGSNPARATFDGPVAQW